ncbi:MAG: oligoribonuclease [Pseudomonadales bacterium]|nr:oligoribonuclease [Pseudomonadales bacterium]
MTQSSDKMVWMDLEMTGLEPDRHVIIEMATLVTDSELNILARGPELAIEQPEHYLEDMDEWNVSHHTNSGLLARVRGEESVTQTEAEALTLAFLEQHVEKNTAPLCGNSIWQDRRFLARHMPDLEKYLHYRIIDVSTLKELARRWRPEVLALVVKKGEHLALADILESIKELEIYREHLFK